MTLPFPPSQDPVGHQDVLILPPKLLLNPSTLPPVPVKVVFPVAQSIVTSSSLASSHLFLSPLPSHFAFGSLPAPGPRSRPHRVLGHAPWVLATPCLFVGHTLQTLPTPHPGPGPFPAGLCLATPSCRRCLDCSWAE